MTKEELKQEAEKWLRKFLLCNDCKRKCHCIELNAYCEEQVLKAYIDSAEPREKRIADLEAQIERNKIDLAISEHDREHNDYELTEAYKKIEQLEKENAEAKNLVEELASSLSVVGECGKEECELINKAQKFINKPIF